MAEAGLNNRADHGANARLWLGALAVVNLARLAVAASHPLFETECYYWLWSRYLAFGYFDHPPMLAWFIWLTDFWGPPHPLAARMHGIIAHFAASVLIYFFTRNLFDSKRYGVRAAILFNAIPIFGLVAVQSQPDTPLVFFWALTLVAFERALATEKPGWWILAGLAAGGALLSKFHAFFLIGCLGLYLAVSIRDRRRLLSPWLYLAGLIALVVYAPNIYWNSTHDWACYAFQFSARFGEGGFEPEHIIATIAAPFAYLSPRVYIVALGSAVWAARRGFAAGLRRRQLPLLASAPLFLFFVAVSFNKMVKFHWPAVAFVALLPVMAADLERWTKRRRIYLYISAATLTIPMHVWLLHPYPFNRKTADSWIPATLRLDESEEIEEDYSCRRYGWPELGEYLRNELERADPDAPRLIVSRRFDRAAAAAFFAQHPEAAFVPDVENADPRAFLYHPVEAARPGANALLVMRSPAQKNRKRAAEVIRESFKGASKPVRLDVERNGQKVREWMIVPCEGLRAPKAGSPQRRFIMPVQKEDAANERKH